MLHFLLINLNPPHPLRRTDKDRPRLCLDLDLLTLLHLFDFSIFVSQFRSLVIQILFRDLPKRIDLVLHPPKRLHFAIG